MEQMMLIGAETVQSAGHAMQRAADDMKHAANTIAESNEQQRQFLNELIERLRGAFENHITMLRQS